MNAGGHDDNELFLHRSNFARVGCGIRCGIVVCGLDRFAVPGLDRQENIRGVML